MLDYKGVNFLPAWREGKHGIVLLPDEWKTEITFLFLQPVIDPDWNTSIIT